MSMAYAQMNSVYFSKPDNSSREAAYLWLEKVDYLPKNCKLPKMRDNVYQLYQVILGNINNVHQLKISQSFFYCYTGLDSLKKEKHIIIDSNLDNDLNNDSLYSVPLSGYVQFDLQNNPMSCESNISYTYTNNSGDKVQNLVPIVIFPYYKDKPDAQYASLKDSMLDVGLFSMNNKNGLLNINDSEYLLLTSSTDLLPFTLNIKSRFSFYEIGSNKKLYSNRTLGDTVSINGRMLVLKEIISDTLYIEDAGNSSVTNIYVRSLGEKEKISLQTLLVGKYVFIDFWGSWCKPCIHSLPHLKYLYEKIKDRDDVVLMGIALEKKTDLRKLQDVILQNELCYPNYFIFQDESKNLGTPHVFFQINSYPTYVLLNRKGNVIFQNSGADNIEKAVGYFLQMIKEESISH